jgi:hypothetical protein
MFVETPAWTGPFARIWNSLNFAFFFVLIAIRDVLKFIPHESDAAWGKTPGYFSIMAKAIMAKVLI